MTTELEEARATIEKQAAALERLKTGEHSNRLQIAHQAEQLERLAAELEEAVGELIEHDEVLEVLADWAADRTAPDVESVEQLIKLAKAREAL